MSHEVMSYAQLWRKKAEELELERDRYREALERTEECAAWLFVHTSEEWRKEAARLFPSVIVARGAAVGGDPE